MADDEKKSMDEKQEPEKPKKKKREGGGMPLPIMIAIGLGAILIQVVLVVGVLKFVFPQHENPEDANTDKSKTEQKKKEEEKKKKEGNVDYGDLEDNLSRLDKVFYMDIGKIITNPKGVSSTFVVLTMAVEFTKLNEDSKELKKIEKDGKIAEEEPVVKKLMANIKSTVNDFIGGMSIEDLQAKRPQLEDMLKVKLRPVFREFELGIIKVHFLEFMIQ